jgi:hypothetical protein
MYYAFIQDNKIIGSGQCPRLNCTGIEITEEIYNNIEHYIWDGEAVVLNPNYDAEQLEKAKEIKCEEALQKANDYQQNGSVEYKNCVFEMSDSNRKNLSDTEEALKLMGETETTWLDKDDNYVVLTIEDIQYIRLNLILAAIQQLWIVKYPYYKQLIEEAETIEEVKAIVIDYIEEEEDENIPPEVID